MTPSPSNSINDASGYHALLRENLLRSAGPDWRDNVLFRWFNDDIGICHHPFEERM
jgi:hypothetical protein